LFSGDVQLNDIDGTFMNTWEKRKEYLLHLFYIKISFLFIENQSEGSVCVEIFIPTKKIFQLKPLRLFAIESNSKISVLHTKEGSVAKQISFTNIIHLQLNGKLLHFI